QAIAEAIRDVLQGGVQVEMIDPPALQGNVPSGPRPPHGRSDERRRTPYAIRACVRRCMVLVNPAEEAAARAGTATRTLTVAGVTIGHPAEAVEEARALRPAVHAAVRSLVLYPPAIREHEV